MRILLVDDEASIVEALGCVLRDLGHDVTTAADGEEALGLCAAAAFDLVVSDIRMPRVDGMQLLQRLRAGSVQTPVILISGHREEAASIPTDPGVAFLHKPMRLRDLLACMASVSAAGPDR